MNRELIKQLKNVKSSIVNKDMWDEELEEQQAAVTHLEEVVSYLNDMSGKGINFE